MQVDIVCDASHASTLAILALVINMSWLTVYLLSTYYLSTYIHIYIHTYIHTYIPITDTVCDASHASTLAILALVMGTLKTCHGFRKVGR